MHCRELEKLKLIGLQRDKQLSVSVLSLSSPLPLFVSFSYLPC